MFRMKISPVKVVRFWNSSNVAILKILACIRCYFSPIEYGYHVSRIPYADYRVNELIPILNGIKEDTSRAKSRVLRKRYGIKIEFHQAGLLGWYSKFVRN